MSEETQAVFARLAQLIDHAHPSPRVTQPLIDQSSGCFSEADLHLDQEYGGPDHGNNSLASRRIGSVPSRSRKPTPISRWAAKACRVSLPPI